MKHTDIRRILGATVSTGGLTLAGCVGTNNHQGGSGGGMMGNGWMGGFGGPWMLLLIVAVVGLVAWIVGRGRNRN